MPREIQIPAAYERLRTPEYLEMVEAITDDDATTIFGASAIGILEADIWQFFHAVPTREMIWRVSGCKSMRAALRTVDKIVAECRTTGTLNRQGASSNG